MAIKIQIEDVNNPTPKEDVRFCSQCGLKLEKKEIEISQIEIGIKKDFCQWIDQSTEAILQHKEIRTMFVEYNDIYDSETGKRITRTIAFCPNYIKEPGKHDVKKVLKGFMGIMYEQL